MIDIENVHDASTELKQHLTTPDVALLHQEAARRGRLRKQVAGVGVFLLIAIAGFGLTQLRDMSESTRLNTASGEPVQSSTVSDSAATDEPWNVVIFLREDSTDAEVDEVLEVVRNTESIERYQLQGQQEVYEEFVEHFEGEPELLDTISIDSMPIAINIVTRDGFTASALEAIEDLAPVRTVVESTDSILQAPRLSSEDIVESSTTTVVAPSTSSTQPEQLRFETTVETTTDGFSVQFEDEGNSKQQEHLWDFGDGNSAVGNPVTHIYESEGLYSVKLTVADSPGQEQVTQTVVVAEPQTAETPTTTTTEPTATTQAPASTTEAPTTTTSTPPVVDAPPSFAPVSNPRVSAVWLVASLWEDGVRIADGEYRELSVLGRTMAASDGCFGHARGVLFLAGDGTAVIDRGTFFDSAECDDPVSEIYSQAVFGATDWGLTSEGNLVLTDGTTLVEFEQAEAGRVLSPDGMSVVLADLPQSSGEVVRFNNENDSGVSLDISGNTAVLTIDECGNVTYDVAYDPSGEGTISFTVRSSDDFTTCPNPHRETVLEHLGSANYYASNGFPATAQQKRDGSIFLWSDHIPLASFFTLNT